MSSNITKNDAEGSQIQRLFFALWPNETLRQQIHRHSKSILRHGGGRPVASGNLHITLSFLGNVDASQQACVEQVANNIQCPPLKFTVDIGDYWSKPRILWIGPSEIPENLVHLAKQLRDGAIECGLQMDMRPYKAHVTLMRKVNKAPVEMKLRSFVWKADSFVLVKSTTFSEGVQYDVVKEWRLSESA